MGDAVRARPVDTGGGGGGRPAGIGRASHDERHGCGPGRDAGRTGTRCCRGRAGADGRVRTGTLALGMAGGRPGQRRRRDGREVGRAARRSPLHSGVSTPVRTAAFASQPPGARAAQQCFDRVPRHAHILVCTPACDVGRAVELDRIGAAMGGNRLVTLSGPGGVGRTRLARRAVSSVNGTDGGAAWADLAPLRDGRFLAAAWRTRSGCPTTRPGRLPTRSARGPATGGRYASSTRASIRRPTAATWSGTC